MKRNLVVVAAVVAVFAVPAISEATMTVWFNYAGGDATLAEPGPGDTPGVLKLEKDEAPGTYVINLELWGSYAQDATEGNYSYSINLRSDGNIARTAWGNTNTAYSGGAGGNVPGADAAGAVAPAPFASNFGGATFSGAGYIGGPSKLGDLSLEITKSDTGTISIWGGVGSQGFGTSLFSFVDTVVFGTSEGVAGGLPGGVYGEDAMVVITNIPEPATVALIGLGALALIRRRR